MTCFLKVSGVAFALLLLLSLINVPITRGAVLDIGTDYRERGIILNKTDYGQDPNQSYAYYSQRALAHIGGRFSPNIEMMTQFQAVSIVGSTTTAIPYSAVDPTGGRYPNTNFQPFVQWAYLKARQLYDTPMDITVGRQPITIGDGLLLSDDDLGFTGIRVQGRLPMWDLRADAFTFKTADTFRGTSDADVYGLRMEKPYPNVHYELMWLTQRDATGNATYVRPSENPSSPTSPLFGSDLHATRIQRNFIDGRFEGRFLEGGFYKGEVALQNGTVERSSPTLSSVQLGGYAFLFSGGLYARTSKYGPIEIHFSFGQASGDSGGSKDNAFNPGYGHQFDGMERSGFGEYYAATLYNAQPSSATASGLPPGFSGIRVIGAGVTTHPTALLSIGVDYFVYNAMESAGAAFQKSSTNSSLGTELDLGAGFAYTNYLSFRGSFALFQPGAAFQYTNNATRYLIEAVGHF